MKRLERDLGGRGLGIGEEGEGLSVVICRKNRWRRGVGRREKEEENGEIKFYRI